MLNDLSTYTRLSIFMQMLGLGLLVGSLLGVGGDLTVVVVLIVVSLVVSFGWLAFFLLWTRRLDQRMREEVDRASAEVVAGTVEAPIASGRVVRRRVSRSPSAWQLRAGHTTDRAVLLVVTVLPPDGEAARRVAVAVPADLGLRFRTGQPVAVALHPTSTEVAVLDDTITVEGMARLDADPRWTTDTLPSDRAVVGGWLGVVVAGLVGLGLGVGTDWLVVSLSG